MQDSNEAADPGFSVDADHVGKAGTTGRTGSRLAREMQPTNSSARTPQSGIFALATSSVSYVEFDLHSGGEPTTIMQLLADPESPPGTTGDVTLVISFRPELWRLIASHDIADEITGFDGDLVAPDGYTMPATQRDVFISAGGNLSFWLDPGRRLTETGTPINPKTDHT